MIDSEKRTLQTHALRIQIPLLIFYINRRQAPSITAAVPVQTPLKKSSQHQSTNTTFGEGNKGNGKSIH